MPDLRVLMNLCSTRSYYWTSKQFDIFARRIVGEIDGNEHGILPCSFPVIQILEIHKFDRSQNQMLLYQCWLPQFQSYPFRRHPSTKSSFEDQHD